MNALWEIYLYQPLFNGLIWLYNNVADQNLGWAIVYLTLIIRFALLPFTILTERNQLRNDELNAEIKKLNQEMANDPVAKKQAIRALLKKKKIYPWTKAVTLGIQGLVILLLYEVFTQGTSGERIIKTLYPFIEFPGKINTMFFGFDINATHTFFWPGLIALWLAAEIYIELKKDGMITKAELWYFIFFPLFTFALLWWLPLVKSIFVLTSMVFSVIVHQITLLFVKKKSEPEAAS